MLGGAEGIVKGHGWLYGRHLAVMWPLDAGGRVTVHLYVPAASAPESQPGGTQPPPRTILIWGCGSTSN